MSKEFSAEDFFNAGIGAASMGNYSMAIRLFDSVLRLEPESKEAWVNKGKVNAQWGKIDDAITCYKSALDIKPNFMAAMKELGRLYYKKKQFFRALFWSQKYIGYGNSDAEMSEIIAHCSNLDDYEESYFISYPWKNQEFVFDQLVPLLDANRIDYFVDRDRIPQAEEIHELPWQLEQGVAQNTNVIVVWSKHTNLSYWMSLELCNAIGMHKRIFIINIDDEPLPAFIYEWHRNQTICLIKNTDKFGKSDLSTILDFQLDPFDKVMKVNSEVKLKKFNFLGVEFEFVELLGGVLNNFLMGRYPVTQQQWEAVMGNNPSRYKGDKNRPVENVSWVDVQAFLKRLNGQYQETFRIPNDHQWEYACRAGSLGNWCFGDNEDTLFEYAWMVDNTGVGDAPSFMVGQARQDGFPTTTLTIETSPYYTNSIYSKIPNKWGIYHMHGNVWEWCDNDSPSADGLKLIRGGSFKDYGRKMRCSFHAYYPPDEKQDDIGFRICKKMD